MNERVDAGCFVSASVDIDWRRLEWSDV